MNRTLHLKDRWCQVRNNSHKKGGWAEDAARDSVIRVGAQFFFDVLTLRRCEDIARTDAGAVDHARQLCLVTQIARIGPYRSIDRIVPTIEDANLLRGDRPAHQLERICYERIRIRGEGHAVTIGG